MVKKWNTYRSLLIQVKGKKAEVDTGYGGARKGFENHGVLRGFERS